MTIEQFHPAVQAWWRGHFGAAQPTAAQQRAWSAIAEGRDTLLAAPTGSGKTLAAFLHAIDALLRAGLDAGELPPETRIIYVSPLKALSADIHRNLAEPRREIARHAAALGLPPVHITAAVRTGDTPQGERAAMLRTPPHILVTTPESLYLLLTAERSRGMLRTATTVIIDEIHAVVETRRGAHLALSLERLDHAAGRRLQRIGLSATQRPIERVADFLTGTTAAEAVLAQPARPARAVIDAGHVRERDIALEVTGSPLESVMSAEIWDEVYDRLAQLIEEQRTTLVFVNTRRLAERVAHKLTERLGESAVTAHHGSLAREVRLDAEERLKGGRLRALVATASLELGIDIGHVDLVCQIGSPRRIATFLQRVGRSGHSVQGMPRGRIFPLSRDDLVEATALLRAVRRGELDRIIIPPRPLDVLAQQIVAESACEDWNDGALYELVRRAYPYHDLEREEFDQIVDMLARGISTHRGRRAALVHFDAVHGRIRGRKGSRLLAITSGGAIPDVTDYRVVLEPEGTFIGTLNEDFAIESVAGDIFLLGNTSWRILRVQQGVVRVADAHGQPPSVPFWLGEAPARSDELSAEVSALRREVESRLDPAELSSARPAAAFAAVSARADGEPSDNDGAHATARRWLVEEIGVPESAALQIVMYLAETRRLLGAVPTQDTIVLERFFDDGGGMQLVLHAPFGSRINRAWGLALRKKFCQNFDFELQAAATDEGLLLSLGPQHSFPLEDVFRYLHPATVRETLIQAMLDSPIFLTRWKWIATLALTVPRNRNGRRMPAQIQRMIAEDLLASVFPDATACLEHVAGAREIPDHPLVRQAIRDCLEEAMDLTGLLAILERLLAGGMRTIARDTTEPSPLAHEIVNARVYQFLDGAPLEERRTHAVQTRRALEPSAAHDLGALDAAAIERVRGEAWPVADNPDELHDALLTSGFILDVEIPAPWRPWLDTLRAERRVLRARGTGIDWWVAAERAHELRAAVPTALWAEAIPAIGRATTDWSADAALTELLRSRLDVAGPVTDADSAAWFGLAPGTLALETALLSLEHEGRILRGRFTPGGDVREWCDRRLLARIHRLTLDRLRAEIEPVSGADFMRYLFRWQHVAAGEQMQGVDGLAHIVDQLAGFECAAGAWETDVLPLRCAAYSPEQLDQLMATGRAMWGRRCARPDSGQGPVRTTPITLLPRAELSLWMDSANDAAALSGSAAIVLAALRQHGASFFHEIVAHAGLLPTQVEEALAALVAAGWVTADSFTGIRALLTPSGKRAPLTTGAGRRRRAHHGAYSVGAAGRWSIVSRPDPRLDRLDQLDHVGQYAQALLRRYGVVARRVLAREALAPAWRDLVRAFRRLEARGAVRGGRFVASLGGEQFALPEALGLLRATRRTDPAAEVVVIAAVDPLNLVGIVTPGPARVTAHARHRILFHGGVPVAALVRRELVRLADADCTDDELRRALAHRGPGAALRPHMRSVERRAASRRTPATAAS